MTTTRLPDDLEQKLDAASKVQHRPKSEFVKEALAQYFVKEATEQSSWELGQSYFGKYGSGDGSLSATYKQRLREKIHASTHSH
jgi:predicted DNA-binding protein